jgi:hypothetical protein
VTGPSQMRRKILRRYIHQMTSQRMTSTEPRSMSAELSVSDHRSHFHRPGSVPPFLHHQSPLPHSCHTVATQLRTEDTRVLSIWSAPVLTALFCRTNSARTEKAPSSRSTGRNEAVSAGDACPPHGKLRCLEFTPPDSPETGNEKMS